jgi:hypothetical protein
MIRMYVVICEVFICNWMEIYFMILVFLRRYPKIAWLESAVCYRLVLKSPISDRPLSVQANGLRQRGWLLASPHADAF